MLSNDNSGVPEPSPGSLVPQKNSASVTAADLLFKPLTKVFLNTGPQFPFSSLILTLNKFIPDPEKLVFVLYAVSMASEKFPSKASRVFPLPSPGSLTPKKYSPEMIFRSL